MRHVIFIYFLRTSSVGWRGAARLDILFSFPCSADHERDWPPCKVPGSFFRDGNQYAEYEEEQQNPLWIGHIEDIDDIEGGFRAHVELLLGLGFYRLASFLRFLLS